MFAIHVRSPWKAALAGAVLAVLLGRGEPGPEPGLAGSGEPAYVHVKLRAPRAEVVALHGMAGHVGPLFTHLSPDAHRRSRALDPRAAPAAATMRSALAEQLAARSGGRAGVRRAGDHAAGGPAPTRRRGTATSCPITTPSFESYQGYLGPAPHGIDAPAAWRRGLRGAGRVVRRHRGRLERDARGPARRSDHARRRRADPTIASWRAHGTAVLGEVVGRDNGKGVVGIAPDVERVFTSSIGGIAVADAIDAAAERAARRATCC